MSADDQRGSVDDCRQDVGSLSAEFPGVILIGSQEDVDVVCYGFRGSGGAVVLGFVDLKSGLDGQLWRQPQGGLPDGVVDGQLGVEEEVIRVGPRGWYDGDAVDLSPVRGGRVRVRGQVPFFQSFQAGQVGQ